MNYQTLDQAKIHGKTVLLRAGFDVPIENGTVQDTERIEKMLPTIRAILDAGAALIIMAHQGRPKGKRVPELSQKPLVEVLKELVGTTVEFADSCIGEKAEEKAANLQPGEVLLLENLRYEAGEEVNDPEFAKKLATLADIYVNDAFTNCHRSHTSMVGVPKLLPAYMGLQLKEEVDHLGSVLQKPKEPVVLIVSGAKMETKVPFIREFLEKGDHILIGGCIANTFLAARGFDIGSSKYEEGAIETAREIMLESEKEGRATLHIPRDAVVATAPAEDAEKLDLPIENIMGDMAIFDIGKVSIKRYAEVLASAGTIIWNGPLGLYEYNRFSHATKRIAEVIAQATSHGATSIIGGGDTLDFHKRYNYPLDAYSFCSTGGGAMLSLLAGEKMEALHLLMTP